MNEHAELQEPADVQSIAAAESALAVSMPDQVRELYEATNGVWDQGGQWFFMWRLEDLVQWNLDAWELEGEKRRPYLGFGDNGFGNPFCVELEGGSTVYTWSAIDQHAYPLAPGMREFWVGWLAGEIGT